MKQEGDQILKQESTAEEYPVDKIRIEWVRSDSDRPKSGISEPKSNRQLLPDTFHVAGNQNPRRENHVNETPMTNTAPKPKKKCNAENTLISNIELKPKKSGNTSPNTKPEPKKKSGKIL